MLVSQFDIDQICHEMTQAVDRSRTTEIGPFDSFGHNGHRWSFLVSDKSFVTAGDTPLASARIDDFGIKLMVEKQHLTSGLVQLINMWLALTNTGYQITGRTYSAQVMETATGLLRAYRYAMRVPPINPNNREVVISENQNQSSVRFDGYSQPYRYDSPDTLPDNTSLPQLQRDARSGLARAIEGRSLSFSEAVRLQSETAIAQAFPLANEEF